MNGHNNIIYEHNDGTINGILKNVGVLDCEIDSRYETYQNEENVKVFKFKYMLKNNKTLIYTLYIKQNGKIDNLTEME